MDADTEKTQGIDPRQLRALEKQLQDDRLAVNRCAGGQTGRALSEDEIVAEFFKYHAPNGTTLPKYAAINQAAKNFAEVVLANCPSGADRAAAIRQIREARMTANAAIALNGLSLY